MGSDRLRHALKIDPNAVRKAPKGKAWVYRYGYTVEVQVSRVVIDEREQAAVLRALGLLDEAKRATQHSSASYEAYDQKEEAPGAGQAEPQKHRHGRRNRGNFKLP